MTIPRPRGEYKSQMTTPPEAWPEADEDAHSRRAAEIIGLGLKLEKAAGTWDQTCTFLFDGHTWDGQASNAGKHKAQSASHWMQSIGELLRTAIGFHRSAYETIRNAKEHVVANCDAAQKVIDQLKSFSLLSKDDQQTREAAIKAVVGQALQANSAVVSAAGTAITAGQPYPPVLDKDIPDFSKNVPDFAGREQGTVRGAPGAPSSPTKPTNASSDGQSQRASPEPSAPADTAGPTKPTNSSVDGRAQLSGPVPSGAAQPTNSPVDRGGQPQNIVANGSSAAAASPPSAPTVANQMNPSPPSMGPSPGSPSSSGGAPSGGSSSSSASNAGSSSATPSPASDFQQAKSEAADTKSTQTRGAAGGAGGDKAPAEQFAKGLGSAQGAATQQPTLTPAAATAPLVTPLAHPTDPAASAPASHTAGSTGGSAGGGGSLPGGGGGGSFGTPSSSAPTPAPLPLGPPATPPPAGPPPAGSGSSQPAATANTGPGVNPASTGKTDPATAGMAPLPVSAARMQRDAVASASTAGAMQRHRGNASAAVIQARRIAAALNMGAPQYGFFWVTGLTADGSIVVANSYGLGYIPEGVELPPQVTMATADESIPGAERAKWATYPILAIQGWAQAHDQRLRAVIATAEQFASFDPGMPKVILQRDDIPQNGKMQGRSRLEVIAPEAAARLAAVGDGALQDLLPVAPTDSSAPDDQLAALWFELTKPLMSTASTRGLTQLEAFVTYAEHAQQLALHKAHNAIDAAIQRAAIADWVYWQHLSVLMSDAVSADATV